MQKKEKMKNFCKNIFHSEIESHLSIHTCVSFFLSISAFVVYFCLIFLNLYNLKNNELQNFFLSIFECFFAFLGLFFIDFLNKDINFQFKARRYFQKRNQFTLNRVIILLLSNFVIKYYLVLFNLNFLV